MVFCHNSIQISLMSEILSHSKPIFRPTTV